MSQKDERISKLADSLHVRSCVEELVAISGKSAPPAAVNLLIRLLRPAASDMSEFSNALKQKIRQSLLSRVGGAALTAKFEK